MRALKLMRFWPNSGQSAARQQTPRTSIGRRFDPQSGRSAAPRPPATFIAYGPSPRSDLQVTVTAYTIRPLIGARRLGRVSKAPPAHGGAM